MTATVPSSQPLLAEKAASHAYRGHADRYDQRTRTFQHWREQLVARLPVGSGDTVLDVGCGTGLCMPGLQDKIGPGGRIIGIDASPDMLALAAKRVTESGWRNVHLINAPVGEADIDGAADAALFCAVHDVMQSPEAIANVFAHLRPGAAVAAIGGKWPAPWLWSLRKWVADLHAPFITDFTGFDQPWRLLVDYVPDLQVRQLGGGTGYLALGHTPGGDPARSRG
jgi:ubiquinone/menaquinone biosynthesis C-methylase UbiE